jgi:hypothetical protein
VSKNEFFQSSRTKNELLTKFRDENNNLTKNLLPQTMENTFHLYVYLQGGHYSFGPALLVFCFCFLTSSKVGRVET